MRESGAAIARSFDLICDPCDPCLGNGLRFPINCAEFQTGWVADMLLVWGTRQTRRKLGFVAEHCPRCNTIRAVRVDRMGVASHLFFVSLGAGPLLGFRGECQTCSGTFEVCPIDYAALEKSKKATLDSLVPKTNPKLMAKRASPHAEPDRALQIRGALLRFEASIRDRYMAGHRFDLATVLAFVATIAVPLCIGWLARSLGLSEDARGVVGWIALGAFLGLLVLSLVLMYQEPRRFFDRKLRPEIVGALRELSPERSELETCVSALRKYGYRISRFLVAERLLADCRGIAVR